MESGEWHYVRGEQQVGPVSFEGLRTLARSGELAREDLVWSEGMADWVAAGSINGVFGRSRRPTLPGPSAPAEAPSNRPSRERGRGPSPGRSASRRTASRPGALIMVGILDLLTVCLTAFAADASLTAEELLRTRAESASTQDEIDRLWTAADDARTAATLGFAATAVLLVLAIAVFTGPRWAPAAQTFGALVTIIAYGSGLARPVIDAANADNASLDAFIVYAILGLLAVSAAAVWAGGSRPPREARRGRSQNPAHRGRGVR